MVQINVITLFVILICNTYENEYCNLKCNSSYHILCQYPPCQQSYLCGMAELLSNNDKIRTRLLHLHNFVRNRVALGNFPNHAKATNMIAFKYSKELEFQAECFARACLKHGYYDECPISPIHGKFGQNYYLMWYQEVIDFNSEQGFKHIMDFWEAQGKYMDPQFVDSYPGRFAEDKYKEINSWTQVIWAKSSFVGCGRMIYQKIGSSCGYLVYCNYAPQGNVVGSPVYKKGDEPCSDCDGKGCNIYYRGLCENMIRFIEEGDFKPPLDRPIPYFEESDDFTHPVVEL